MAKLFVIKAKLEPIAVVFRRGPSRWYHVIQWNMTKDEFIHGAWFKGRIYEEKCDLSPDGRLLLYFVHQGSRVKTEFTDAWTAISRMPWLKALVVWPQGETYGGGGRFLNETSVALRGVNYPPLKDFPATGIKVLEKRLETPVHETAEDVPDADWCGRDHKDRIIFSKGGQLFRRLRGKDTLIADFTDLAPDPSPAPDWASQPLSLSKSTKSEKANSGKRKK